MNVFRELQSFRIRAPANDGTGSHLHWTSFSLNQKKTNKGSLRDDPCLKNVSKTHNFLPTNQIFCLPRVLVLDTEMKPCNALYLRRDRGMLQSYEALCCKVTLLHSELKHQAGLIRKLRPLFSETRQGEAGEHGGTPCRTHTVQVSQPRLKSSQNTWTSRKMHDTCAGALRSSKTAWRLVCITPKIAQNLAYVTTYQCVLHVTERDFSWH